MKRGRHGDASRRIFVKLNLIYKTNKKLLKQTIQLYKNHLFNETDKGVYGAFVFFLL